MSSLRIVLLPIIVSLAAGCGAQVAVLRLKPNIQKYAQRSSLDGFRVLRENPCADEQSRCRLVELAFIRTIADSREEAREALERQARSLGAHAAVLFDWSEFRFVAQQTENYAVKDERTVEMTQVMLYGVAVQIVPSSEGTAHPPPDEPDLLLLSKHHCDLRPIKKVSVTVKDPQEGLLKLKRLARDEKAHALVLTEWAPYYRQSIDYRGVSTSTRMSAGEVLSALLVRYSCSVKRF